MDRVNEFFNLSATSNYFLLHYQHLNISSCSLLVGLVLGVLLYKHEEKVRTFTRHLLESAIKLLTSLGLFSTILTLSPIICLLLLLFQVLRSVTHLYLKLKLQKKYGGLITGADVLWTIDTPSARSIVNIVAILDVSTFETVQTRAKYLLDKMRHVAEEKLLSPLSPNKKTKCRRQKSLLGYFYWELCELTVDKYVDFLETKCDKREISRDELAVVIGECCNREMPDDDRFCWEILVGQVPISQVDETSSSILSFPVLFRVHHSLGDGLSLTRFLLEYLTDEASMSLSTGRGERQTEIVTSGKLDGEKPFTKRPENIKIQPSELCFKFVKGDSKTGTEDAVYEVAQTSKETRIPVLNKKLTSGRKRDVEKVEVSRQTCVVVPTKRTEIRSENGPENKIETGKVREIIWNKILEILVLIIATVVCIQQALVFQCKPVFKILKTASKCFLWAVSVPQQLISQFRIKNPDQILFGNKLSGDKIVAWSSEVPGDKQDLLINKIKRIKTRHKVKFVEVLLACLSLSLEDHYSSQNQVPKWIPIVVPARAKVDDLTNGLRSVCYYQNNLVRAKVTRLYRARQLRRRFVVDKNSFSTSTDSEEERRADRVRTALSNPAQVYGDVDLVNSFTVAVLNLPIQASAPDASSSREVTRLTAVQSEVNKLQNSSHYQINHLLISQLLGLIPSTLWGTWLTTVQSTLVFSNLPGPESTVHLAGCKVRDLIFFVPNRGNTGIGMSVFSYNGHLEIGLIADKALVPTSQLLQNILNNFIEYIFVMDANFHKINKD